MRKSKTCLKKIISLQNLFFVVLFGSLFSCEKPNSNLEENSKNTNSDMARTSSLFENVESLNIDNGLNSNCENNILVFPSWEDFRNIANQLDEMVEIHCDAFEYSTDPNISDEEYEAIAESAGFDEEKPLINFEDDLEFCSLRRMIYNQETEWLSQQGDGEWDSNSDPDNHFIDDIERTLFNEGVEVIIGSRNDGYVLYKFYDWGHVEIHNEDYAALQNINQTGQLPQNNPNVNVVREVNSSSTGSCKGAVDHRKYFSTGTKTKIKTVDKIRNPSLTFFTAPNIKSKTKYYRKKLGDWRRGKTTITAAIKGTRYLGWVSNGCGPAGPVDKWQTKKRSKVKVKEFSFELGNHTSQNSLRGIHKRREDVIKNIDFYSGNVVQ